MKSLIVTASKENESKAKEFAKTYGYAYQADYDDLNKCDYLLKFDSDCISIATKIFAKPFYLDFTQGKLKVRRQQASKKNELLAKAIGLKTNKKMHILDATGGFGYDALIFASLGLEVTILERSPIVMALLSSAFEKLPLLKDRIHLIQTDAISWLTQSDKAEFPYDVIYLDPMFPERRKSSAVKKEMVILRDLVGEDLDAPLLFDRAFACPVTRIVVKRPIHAVEITRMIHPSFTVKGRANRFDIYVKILPSIMTNK